MKVWLTTDGNREVVVAARTKTEAARLMGRSLYSFNQFAMEQYAEHPNGVLALAEPGVVFTRSNRRANEPWEREGPRW